MPFSLFNDRVDNNIKHQMTIKILQEYKQNINKEQEDNEGSSKKINLKYDDASHFLKKNLPFSLLNNKLRNVFQ